MRDDSFYSPLPSLLRWSNMFSKDPKPFESQQDQTQEDGKGCPRWCTLHSEGPGALQELGTTNQAGTALIIIITFPFILYTTDQIYGRGLVPLSKRFEFGLTILKMKNWTQICLFHGGTDRLTYIQLFPLEHSQNKSDPATSWHSSHSLDRNVPAGISTAESTINTSCSSVSAFVGPRRAEVAAAHLSGLYFLMCAAMELEISTFLLFWPKYSTNCPSGPTRYMMIVWSTWREGEEKVFS